MTTRNRTITVGGRAIELGRRTCGCDVMCHKHDAAPEMLKALRGAEKLIDALMPGIRHIAVQDYQAVNEVPIAIRRAIAKAVA